VLLLVTGVQLVLAWIVEFERLLDAQLRRNLPVLFNAGFIVWPSLLRYCQRCRSTLRMWAQQAANWLGDTFW